MIPFYWIKRSIKSKRHDHRLFESLRQIDNISSLYFLAQHRYTIVKMILTSITGY